MTRWAMFDWHGKVAIITGSPWNQPGRVEELIGTAIYPASAATNFMTGACIVTDGGQTIW